MVERTVVVGIGGADQGEVVLLGDGEADARVGQLEDIGVMVVEQLGHDDMRSAHRGGCGSAGSTPASRATLLGRRAAGIDQRARAVKVPAAVSTIHMLAFAPGGR